MTGFALDWLALREPADKAARAPQLLAMAKTHLASRPGARVVDLGCGTGSTLRAFDGVEASWTLVDHDPALLAAARDMAAGRGDVAFVEADLRDLEALPLAGAQLVTASALFDLVSERWLADFAAHLVGNGTALYAALSYDGTIVFDETHDFDESAVAAFNAHQAGDKGFGPALGPRSGERLVSHFVAGGFAVEMDGSPWRLLPGVLHEQFVRGVAEAVLETGLCDTARLHAWLEFRLSREREGGCSVGHVDVVAMPPDGRA